MTTVAIRVPDRLATTLDWLTTAWRHWIYRLLLGSLRLRESSLNLDPGYQLNPRRLIWAGQFSVAVWVSRLAMEGRLRECCELVAEGKAMLDKRSYSLCVPFLRAHGLICAPTAKKIQRSYEKASKIVHTGICDRDKGVELVRQIEDCLYFLDQAIANRKIEALDCQGGVL